MLNISVDGTLDRIRLHRCIIQLTEDEFKNIKTNIFSRNYNLGLKILISPDYNLMYFGTLFLGAVWTDNGIHYLEVVSYDLKEIKIIV